MGGNNGIVWNGKPLVFPAPFYSSAHTCRTAEPKLARGILNAHVKAVGISNGYTVTVTQTPTGRLRYFPVRDAIGVDISDVSVELLELTRSAAGTLTVHALSHAELPTGVVQNGEILDPQRLQTILRETLAAAQPRPFRSRNAIVALPETRVFLRAFEFPHNLTEDQINRTIPFEAEGALPLTLNEVSYDVQFHRSRASTHHVLFAAAPKSVVDAYLETLTKVGLHAIALDVESAALARSIVGAREEPVLVVDIGGRATVISVVEREVVHTTVTIPVAGDAFTEQTARILRLSPEDAETRKRQEGLLSSDAQFRDALTETLTPIILEIQRTLQYHEAHTGRAVRTLYLAGGSAQLPGIVEYFTQTTGAAAQVGDPWTTRAIHFPSTIPEQYRSRLTEARGALATVVGLALRGVSSDAAAGGLNLLPHPIRETYTKWRTRLIVASLAILVAITTLTLGTIVTASASARWLQAQRTSGEAERVRADVLGERFLKGTEQTRRVNAELASLKSFRDETPDVAALLTALRATTPPGITLQRIDLKVPPKNTEDILVTVAGLADRRETYLAFESRLRTFERVQKLDSPLSNLNLPEQAPFTVSLSLKRP